MKNTLTLFISALTLSVNVFAADAKPAKKAEKKAAVASAETYKVDTAASTVNWKGTKKVGSSHNGNVKIQSGEFKVENNMIKSGDVVVDMKTITDTDLTDEKNNKKLVGHLSSPDFFNAEKHPTATFKLTSVAPAKAKDVVMVKGDLTMVGKTNPIEFPATVKFENGTATGEATVKIDRTKWDLKYNSGNYFKDLAGDKIINDEFELNLKIVAKK